MVQPVAQALNDESFHTNPSREEINYSDNEDEEEENDEDEDEDEYDESGDDESDSKSSFSSDDEASSDDEEDGSKDECSYFDVLNSTLLEDDKISVSYRVDWVKRKGASRKAEMGWPPKPVTTNMNADDAKEAIISWEKKWKREKDMQRHKNFHDGQADGCSFINNSICYTSCIAELFWPMTEVTKFALAEGHTFPDKETLLM